MTTAYLISDMFGDLAPMREQQYLQDWERLLKGSGFPVQVVYLNRIAKLNTFLENDEVVLQERLHAAYLHGGLEIAVQHLEALFAKNVAPSLIIAFSLGGYAAWLSAESLVSKSRIVFVSSTRLRLSSNVLSHVKTMAIFGENDPNAPSLMHLRKLKIAACYVDGDHGFYRNIGSYEALVWPWLTNDFSTDNLPC
jgi:hypothetical protein